MDFKNVARSIALARRAAIGEIWLLTSSPLRSYPGVARVFSCIPAADCAAVYRSCDVLLKLSTVEGMFGPPLEMFHCGGTAIVYDVTGHDEYIRSEENALVVPIGDETGVIAALRRLAHDPGLLPRLEAEAMQTAAAWPDWPDSGARFLAALQSIQAAPPTIDATRLRLWTTEFWAQYVRAEQALRAGSPSARFAARSRAVLPRLLARSPGLRRRTAWARAVLLEARARPLPRTRI